MGRQINEVRCNEILLSVAMSLVLLLGCTSSSKNPEAVSTSHVHDSVVFIFENFYSLAREKRYEDGTTFTADYPDFIVKDGVNSIRVNPSAIKGDTVIVATQNNSVVVYHRINLIESFEYLIKKGDSVLFTYRDEYGKPQLLNRKGKLHDLDWERRFRKKELSVDSFSTMAKYSIPELASNSINGIDYKQVKAKLYPLYKVDLNKEEILLDSLRTHETLSDDVYNHFKNRVQYRLLALEVENNKLDSIEMAAILTTGLSVPEGPYSHAEYFLNVVLNKLYIDNAKLLNNGSRVTRDHRAVFDKIRTSTVFPREIKDKLLFQQLTHIAAHFSLKDFKTYYEKFKTDNADTALLNKIKSAYLVDFDELRNSSKDLNVISSSKEKFTFDSIKSIHHGKLIYVDFWASWCGPCRQAMPASKKLMEKYADKVVFIYLSTDRDYEKWKIAARIEGLEFYENNYLMLNPHASAFLNKMDFNEIPRYMLFDERGNLLHAKAPGPSTRAIEKLIDDHLLMEKKY